MELPDPIKNTRLHWFYRVVFWAIIAAAILLVSYTTWTSLHLVNVQPGTLGIHSRAADAISIEMAERMRIDHD